MEMTVVCQIACAPLMTNVNVLQILLIAQFHRGGEMILVMIQPMFQNATLMMETAVFQIKQKTIARTVPAMRLESWFKHHI